MMVQVLGQAWENVCKKQDLRFYVESEVELMDTYLVSARHDHVYERIVSR